MQFLSPLNKVMKVSFLLGCAAILFAGSIGFAADSVLPGGPESYSTFDSAFQDGIKNYKEKKYDSSITAYQKSLGFEPQNIAALTNLALAQFQSGKKAWALALLRRVLNIDPRFSTARDAYDFIFSQLEVKEIPHDILLSESLRSKLLSQFSFFWFSCLCALFIFAAGWSLLSFFGKLKKSKTSESPPPNFHFLAFIYSLGAVLFAILLVLKVVDQVQTRGTVVADTKVNVLSSPDASAPALFEIYPGLEVIIKKTSESGDNKWSQVNYPGGATGWLPSSNLFITTE